MEIPSISSGGGAQDVKAGNAGPATSGSNGQFWADFSNGDFIVGGSKNDMLTTILIVVTVIAVGFMAWKFTSKKKKK